MQPEQVAHLTAGEGEVVVAELGERPLDPVPVQGQPRFDPGQQHQVGCGVVAQHALAQVGEHRVRQGLAVVDDDDVEVLHSA